MHKRGKGETYSLSIRVGDIEVPPPSLRARSGRLAADKRGEEEGKRGEGERSERFHVLVIEAAPEHRPPAPKEKLQKPRLQQHSQKPHYTRLPW